MDNQTRFSLEKGDLLPLMEAFYTIQGEGYHSGKSAFFLRIGGCDVGCHWCDVKESWDHNIHDLSSINNILQEIEKYDTRHVVITGGEPLVWNLNKLTTLLRKQGKKIYLETSGAYPLTGKYDWICLSPKKNKPPIDKIKSKADELKIIISNKHDFKWAEEMSEKINKDCKLYLQPEWSAKDKMIPRIIEYIKKNNKWNISLQTHKYMNIP